jgi:hypothetical protein
MNEASNSMTEKIELPEGTVVLTSAQPNGSPKLDVELAVDLALVGASPTLVRAVGGEQAVLKAKLIAGGRDAA